MILCNVFFSELLGERVCAKNVFNIDLLLTWITNIGAIRNTWYFYKKKNIYVLQTLLVFFISYKRDYYELIKRRV